MASLHTSFPSLPQSKEDRFYMRKKSLKASTGPVVPGALYAITRQRPTALLHDKVTSWAVTGRTHRSTNKSLRSTHRAAVQWLWTQRDDAQPVATCRRCSANVLYPAPGRSADYGSLDGFFLTRGACRSTPRNGEGWGGDPDCSGKLLISI